jgi:phosphate/sulfate permease
MILFTPGIILLLLGTLDFVLFLLYHNVFTEQKMGSSTVNKTWISLHLGIGVASSVTEITNWLKGRDINFVWVMVGGYYFLTAVIMYYLISKKKKNLKKNNKGMQDKKG